MVRLTTVLMTRGLFKWRAAAIGYALAALGSCEMPQWGLPLLFGVSRDRRHVRKMVCDRARPSSENSVCAESVDNPELPRRPLVRACTHKTATNVIECYSITSSARSRDASGIVRPSALAVLRLTANSNKVGCSIGISPGFAPRRIRAT
jgi:hypothetical protein